MNTKSTTLFLEGSLYFYWLIGLNLMFLSTNLILTLALIFLRLTPENSFYFLLGVIPTGPSISAMFACFNKISREKDISLFRDYLKFYKKTFKKSIKIWVISCVLVYIIILNINLLLDTTIIALLMPAYVILVAFIISITIAVFYLFSKADANSVVDIIKKSMYFSVKRSHISLCNVVIFLLWFFVIFIRPLLGIVIMPSIIIFLMSKNTEFVFTHKPMN